MRLRESQQNPLLRPQPMIPGQMNQLNNIRRNNMVPPNLQKTVLQNNTAGLYVDCATPVFIASIFSLISDTPSQFPTADGSPSEKPAGPDNADATRPVGNGYERASSAVPIARRQCAFPVETTPS